MMLPLGAYVILERFWFQKLTTHPRTYAQHRSLRPYGPKNEDDLNLKMTSIMKSTSKMYMTLKLS